MPIEVVVGGMASAYGNVTVINGGARGADRMAGEAAKRRGLDSECYPADWELLGRAAGVLRNQQMLDQGRPDVVFAFSDDLAKSRGTADMVRRAKATGVPVYVIGRAGA